MAYLFWQGQIEQNLFLALLSGIVFAVVSAFDDVLDLTPKVRLLAQAISAAGALFFLGGFPIIPDMQNQLLFWIFNVVAFVGIVWFINLYNCLDEYYASQEAIMVAGGMFLITGNLAFGLLIAEVAGFLAVW